MIQVNNVTVSFSGNLLFDGISFLINPKDRIGLVGKNGVGKSTLLKVIMGTQACDSGGTSKSEGETIGYLPQEIKTDSQKSIYEETLSVFEHIHAMNREIESINQQMAERTDYESEGYSQLIHRVTELHEQLGVHDHTKMESQVGKVLKGLGFKDEEFQMPMSTFSGGWQMRVELAKLLLLSPTLLMLDEPTNHLDIEAIIWLEDYLKNYPGAVLMISHDRTFLDNITNRTIEIVFGKTYDYKVAYSKYMVLREERYEQQMATLKNRQKYIADQERFIERFKAKASKAKQAQSRMKNLERLEDLNIDQLDNSQIQFRFPPAPRSGDVVLRAEKLGKSYGNKTVLKDLRFQVDRGERIAFVGQNGQGKSTLIKLIAEKLEHSGELKIGHNVKVGYYAQVQENTLNQELTVFETIEHVAKEEWRNISRIRSLLGAFLFSEEDIDKKSKVLSGGEKSRLALAKLLLEPMNLLILDEPTNHLDMASKEVLKEALQHFGGTLILVSHDRDFLQGLTNRTFEFKNGGIKEHLGEITEFLNSHDVGSFRDFEANKAPAPKKEKKPKKTEQKAAPKKENKLSYEEKKQLDRAIRKAKNAVASREKGVEETEAKIAALEEQLAEPSIAGDAEKSKKLFFEHAELQNQLEQYMHQWEKLQEEVDALVEQRG